MKRKEYFGDGMDFESEFGRNAKPSDYLFWKEGVSYRRLIPIPEYWRLAVFVIAAIAAAMLLL